MKKYFKILTKYLKNIYLFSIYIYLKIYSLQNANHLEFENKS